MTLGNAIKLVRTAKGTKQRQLAGVLNVSPNYISLLENDRREPSISLLRALADKLDVPVGLFLLWQDVPVADLTRKEQVEELRDLMIRIQALSKSGRRIRTGGRRKG
jgi:transcriptional regulator with XRE-family HTH domain